MDLKREQDSEEIKYQRYLVDLERKQFSEEMKALVAELPLELQERVESLNRRFPRLSHRVEQDDGLARGGGKRTAALTGRGDGKGDRGVVIGGVWWPPGDYSSLPKDNRRSEQEP